MYRVCSSWHVRDRLVMVSRLTESLQLAESIVSIHPHQVAQAQHQLSFLSTLYTALLACRSQCQSRPLPVVPNFHAERSSPHTTCNVNISNHTILDTVKLHTRRSWMWAAYPDKSNPFSILHSKVTMIQSKTWTRFRASHWLETSQVRSLTHYNLLCLSQTHIPGAGAPLSDHIPEQWERNAEGWLGINLQNTPYYLFVTCEEYKYI